MPLPNPVLVAQNVCVHHHKRDAAAIEDASFEVAPGTCVALLGPNGAGKSTLLRAVAGLSTGHVTGTVELFGNNVSHLSARELAHRRAFVPQDNVMPFAFSVREAVSLGAGGSDPGETADAALQRFDLLDFAQRSVVTLSGGERQRVALARAFVQNAPLLLLDEPTAHQDLRYASRVLSEVRAFVQQEPLERAAVAVLHDLNLARDWADAVVLLKDGRIHAQGLPETVLASKILGGIYGTTIWTEPYIRAAP